VQRREGTRRIYAVRNEGFAELRAFLDQFWDDGLAALKATAEREAHGTARRSR
jgi:hypothetical protein